MSTLKPSYTASTALTFATALAGLASGATTFSGVIDNTNGTTGLQDDALIGGSITLASSGVSSTGTLAILVAATVDGTTPAPSMPVNCKLLATLYANTNSQAVTLDAASVAALYGGRLPSKYVVGVTNNSGATLANGTLTNQTVQDTFI